MGWNGSSDGGVSVLSVTRGADVVQVSGVRRNVSGCSFNRQRYVAVLRRPECFETHSCIDGLSECHCITSLETRGSAPRRIRMVSITQLVLEPLSSPSGHSRENGNPDSPPKTRNRIRHHNAAQSTCVYFCNQPVYLNFTLGSPTVVHLAKECLCFLVHRQNEATVLSGTRLCIKK